MKKNWYALAAMLTLIAWAVDAGAETGAAPAEPQRELVRLEDTKLGLVYSVAGLDLKAYNSVVIEPIEVRYDTANRDMYRLDAGDLKRLNEYARDAMTRQLSSDGRYKIVDKPGPGTLVIRAQLADVWLAFSKRAKTGRTYTLGEYAIQMRLEAALVDGATGEVLALAGDRQGDRINNRTRRITSLDAWQQVRKAFDFWAGSLRQALDQSRSTPKP